MAYDILFQSIVAGVLFGGVLAGVYRWFRRKDPASVSQAWKIFFALAILIAVRFYFLHLPD